ncbi:hypothetical protein ACFL5G_02855 [Candidatus Margulisiibacteriota bacterium]
MTPHSSFTITLKNNTTEKEGIKYLLSQDKGFIPLDKNERKIILKAFNLPKNKSRAFDMVYLKNDKKLSNINPADITLIELKVTKKKLRDFPKGFFFGATESEFELARKMGNKYKFCFVCLHPESRSYKLLTLEEVNRLIRTKRTQYQINL